MTTAMAPSTAMAAGDRGINASTLPINQSPTASRRRGMPRGPMRVLMVLLLVSATAFVAEASTLPFGTISTAARAHRELSPTGDASATALHRRLFGTRAGGSTPQAGFVGGPVTAASNLGLEPISYYLRVALAGGVAGATGSAVLYPLDSAKTLRQSDPSAYSSVRDALLQMLRSRNALRRVYSGILPAALGAIPSSALYFGAYESSKMALKKLTGEDSDENGYGKRLFVHGLAAASGNVISSFVFVPKEVIKQQLQVRHAEGAARTTVRSIVRQKGLSGLYAGYGATLLRNIPSATIRFVLYEELKRKWATQDGDASTAKRAGAFLAGAVAGSVSSFAMTPIDVVKTRMATGSCPLGVRSCMLHVLQEVGWSGLYAGAGARVLWSGAFSAIGFGTFELVKGHLGVPSTTKKESSSSSAAR
mmetsp:Transcript_2845/g.7816  ORF Transcript_2845/g.7816 Transcript_2845/m.7816 type:complete len:421 (-) Transcript_2845:417-1679(-)